MVGQNGVAGLHALSPVELVPKNVLEPVLVPLHFMAETLALETRGKNNCATSSHALVRNEFSPIISSLSDFFKIFFSVNIHRKTLYYSPARFIAKLEECIF